MTSVLVVDGDAGLRRALGINLRARGLDVALAGTGAAALTSAAEAPPDVALVDLRLPDIQATAMVRGLRAEMRAPIIVFSWNVGVADKADAIAVGADDYVAKPFGMDRLLRRLRAALRRSERDALCSAVRTPDLAVDVVAMRVSTPGGPVELTPTEWRILTILVRNGGMLVRHGDLAAAVPGSSDARLRSCVAQLRRKLEPDPSRPRYLVAEPGLGYRFDAD